MKIISRTLLIAFLVLSLNIQVSGHDVCSSKRSAYKTAASTVTTKQVALGAAITAESGYIWQLSQQKKPPLPLSGPEALILASLTAAVGVCQAELSAAKSIMNKKKRALDNCVRLDTRDCNNDGVYDDCSIAHTQSSNTCECNCDSGAYGCECGSCSANYN